MALRNVARTFGSDVLKMALGADAKMVAEAIADSVQLRYGDAASDVLMLENMIVERIQGIDGHAKSISVDVRFGVRPNRRTSPARWSPQIATSIVSLTPK